MQIGTATATNPYSQSALGLNEKETQDFKEKIKSGEISGKTLSQAYLVEYSLQIESYSSNNIQAQSAPFDLAKVKDILSSIDFQSIGYTGKPIADMTPEEAKSLVSEEGYFGVSQTSTRLSDFVLNGGGNDLERLKAGREGIITGFNEAEKMWGGKLPDISYETLDKALAKIDERITALGGNVLDTTA
ncbi:hydrogenase-4 component G [Sulfuricurvum sp.]|uniref:hydrogenase-4 component G n=1 Tax=Sulfuricurvum sp. TaxID=2025608 RepID=UPI0025F0A0A0|nr:hydrogenase-4 component G [Sulfuricurvum sp.]